MSELSQKLAGLRDSLRDRLPPDSADLETLAEAANVLSRRLDGRDLYNRYRETLRLGLPISRPHPAFDALPREEREAWEELAEGLLAAP